MRNRNLLPQLVNLGLLVIPANPKGPKPPASVVRTTEDKKSAVLNMLVSFTFSLKTRITLSPISHILITVCTDMKEPMLKIVFYRNLGQCTQIQLAALAKMLNVSAKPSTTNASDNSSTTNGGEGKGKGKA